MSNMAVAPILGVIAIALIAIIVAVIAIVINHSNNCLLYTS